MSGAISIEKTVVVAIGAALVGAMVYRAFANLSGGRPASQHQAQSQPLPQSQAPAPVVARTSPPAVAPAAASVAPLVFAINGERVELASGTFDPTLPLAHYLRYETEWKGTKISCGEGGCGACTVNLSRVIDGKLFYRPASSCLVPLASLDGWAVTTTDGLGSTAKGFHAIQERIAEWNGNQCGFCTPGFVMSTYSALKEAQADGTPLSADDIEYRLDGNLCRCTGYRPILQAVKSLSQDGKDLKDETSGAESRCKAYDPSSDPTFPHFLREHRTPSTQFAKGGITWVRATSLPEVFTAIGETKGRPYRFVVANTSKGIYKEDDEGKVLIDLQHVPELQRIETIAEGLVVGASVSIGRLVKALRAEATKNPAKTKSFEGLARHALRIASYHVRGVASVGGNLSLTKTRGFLSDLGTILLGVGASVTLCSTRGTQTISLDEFFDTPTYADGTILESILIPYTQDAFQSYKSALRPQNAHAIINAAFSLNVSEGKLSRAILAFGGLGEEDKAGTRPVRAKRTEAFLDSRTLDQKTMNEALKLLKSELTPKGAGPTVASVAYRVRLVTGFFFRFFLSLLPSLPAHAVSGASSLPLAPSIGGSQRFPRGAEHEEKAPVGRAIPRPGGKTLAAGEGQYVADIPPFPRTVYGAYVQSTRASCKLVGIDAKAALAVDGVVAVLDHTAVPGTVTSILGGAKPPAYIIAKDTIRFYGQPIALVLATSVRLAEKAAKLVKVTYGDPLPSAISIEEAKLVSKEVKEIVESVSAEYKRGDPVDALKKDEFYVQGSLFFGTSRHFAMEPHVALAVPEEDGGVTVYNALQWPNAVHEALSKSLNLPFHKIRVVVRRLGGGFGGKITQNIPHACMAAVAAHKLGRPVAIHLNRNVDLQTSGGRHSVYWDYQVGFNKSGIISAMWAEGYLNAGYSKDMTPFCSSATSSSADQCYYVPHWRTKNSVYWTNLPTATAVRAPGEIQGSFMIESIIEHVAAISGVRAQDIRERNLYSDAEDKKHLLVAPNKSRLTHYTAVRMWHQLKARANIEKRFTEIDAYNAQNRWRKRGLAMTTVRYSVVVWQKGALVNIYSDGTIIVSHGCSEMGQGANVKIAQAVASTLGQIVGEPIDLKMVRFGDLDSNVVPNQLFTGGSTGSEGAAQAAIRACEILLERLKPIAENIANMKREAKAESLTPSWSELVKEARENNIDLSAEAQWAGRFDESQPDAISYNNYGVAASEIVLDVITGEVELLRTDLIYDCGKSLNPAIDIGQAEGAFIHGVSNYIREKVLVSDEKEDYGRLLSDGTWKYKIAGIKDVPKVFNVELIENKDFDKGILSSKASGEPPLVLATSVLMAIRYAIGSARKDAGLPPFYRLDSPATPEDIAALCGGEFGLD